MKFTKLLFSLLLFMSGYTTLYAQVPKTISYQGYLKDGGTAVTGTHDVAFNIYSVATGGTSIWSETFPSLTFANGNFSVVLGKTTALTFTPLNTLYMGITIDATPEISPRVELTGSLYSLGLALPYAASINSTQSMLNLTNSGTGNAITATGKIQATSFQGDGSLLTGVTSTVADGSVTGGTAGTGVKIAANTITNANISSTAAIAGTKINPNFGAQNVIGNALTATAFSPIGAQQGAYLQWNRSSGEGETWLLNQRGSGGATAGIRFGDASSANVVTEWMRIIQNGNVGIGTISPGQKLSVQGGVNVDNGDAGNGSIANGLSFGFGSGEGISSKRNSGGNQFGLDFYTQTVNRLSITNTGNVGIGTTTPLTPLQIGSAFGIVGAGSDDILAHGIYFDGSNFINRSTTSNSAILIGNGKAGIYTFPAGVAAGVAASPDMRFNVRPSGVGIQVDNPIETFQVNGATYLNPIAAPGVTTDRLYNVGGSLFWNGTNISSSGSAWGLTGVASTVDGTNFIGTTDNVALSFRVNNQKAGRIDPAGPVFLGYQAGANNANATAQLNTGIGSNSLLKNTTGNYNVAIGSSALEQNTTGAENTAVGALVLQNNTTGVFNSGFGYGALYTNSTGSYNTAFGNFSGVGNTTGNYNTAYGNNSLYTNTVGSNNTSIGNQTLSANSAGSNGTAIGAFAMQYYNDSSSPFVNNNVAVGYSALQGSGTPSANTGIQNSAVGYQAMAINTSGQRNAAFGYQAMSSNTTGNGNTAVGQSALTTNALGGANTALGTRALFNNIASNNTAVGNDALFGNTNAGDNAAFGVLSLSANTGAKNTGLGAYSLQSNTTGADNAGVGNSVLLSTTTGSQNTAVGSLAGYTNIPANANTTGSANTFIGYASGPGTPTQLTNATAIGANSSVMASNTIQLGNGSVTTVNVGTGTTAKLVAGQLQITGGTLGAGRVLTSDAGGNATWQPASGTSFSNVNSDFQFANGAARKISIAPEPNTGDAFALTIKGSDATSGSQARNGGDVAIDGGHNYNISIGSSMPGSVYLRSGGNLFSGGNSQPGDIILQTGGITSSASNYTTRLIVKGNGNVGIGITTPSSPLHVVGDAKITGNILFGTASLAITAQSSGEFNFNGFLNPSVDNTYQLGQGSKRWSSIWAAVGTINTSDARQKKNIKNIGYGLPEVLKLRPVSFEWKKGDGRTKLGLIAQETLEVLPEVVAVPTNKEDAYGMYYSDIIPVLIKATQELNTKLEGEKAKNQLLETESKKKIAELEKMLQNLKGENSKLSAEVTETKTKQEQEISLLKKQIEKIMNIVGAEAKRN